MVSFIYETLKLQKYTICFMLLLGKRSIFSVIHNTQSVMSDYPKDNFFGITDGIDRKNTRSRFLETSPRAMAGVWIIPGKILSAAVIASTPV